MAEVTLIESDPLNGRLALNLFYQIQNKRNLFKRLGIFLVSDQQKNFENQSFPGQRWPKLYQPNFRLNVAGAVADLKKSANIKASRFNDTPMLKDTGNLMRSLDYATDGRTQVIAGTNMPYGADQNFGGISSQELTDTYRKNLQEWLKKSTRAVARAAGQVWRAKTGGKAAIAFGKAQALDQRKRVVREKLGWTLNKKLGATRLVTKIQKRQFVGFHAKLERQIWRTVIDFLVEGKQLKVLGELGIRPSGR